MPRRAAARRRSCHSGRMRLIVMPSSHHLQLILSGPIAMWGRGECGRAQMVEPGILCGARRNGKRYQLHQPASNDSVLACRIYPNDPANLIPTPVHATRSQHWLQP